MQIQIDPTLSSISPPMSPTKELRDFQSFIQTALDGLTASGGWEVMTLGTGMFAGLALIVIVIAGVKIAFSGNLLAYQPWEASGAACHRDMDSVGDDAVLHEPRFPACPKPFRG